MNVALAILSLAGYALMLALPRIFFRSDGRMNLSWFLTASPFGLSAVGVALAWAGVIPTVQLHDTTLATTFDVLGMFATVVAIAMIVATMTANRVPLALWHQEDELNAPKQIITYGPYRFVRHPFYVSFLLLAIGAVLIAKDPVTMAAFPLGLLSLDWTVRKEEKKLLASPLGEEYGAYRARTGKFLPRMSRS